MVDGPDTVILKHGRENALENLTIGQHVGDAAGDAEIVFEYGEAAIGKVNQIGAANIDVNIARDAEAAHFAPEVATTIDEVARNDAVVEDFSFAVDVFQE